jgi:RimJ/RimL family protein N-acetyltransferase
MTHRCTTEKPNDHVLLLDATEIAVRRLTEHDVDAVVDLHRQLTDRERYFRFFTMHPAHLEEFARKLVRRTPTRCALGAFENGQLIAVGNYVVTSDAQSAEIAIAVAHEDHLRGVATTLLRLLGSAARSHGIRWFVADVLAENRDMLRVLSGTGWQRTHRFDGPDLTVRIDLESTKDDSPMAD